MNIKVPDLITLAEKKESVRPVDVVMGDHWAEIELGNPRRLSLLYAVLKKQEQGPNAKGGGGGLTRQRVPLSIINRSPQALVKVIKKGGTTNARGMRDQMSYLSKDGDAKLERSERYFGIELNEDTRERLIDSWGLSGETRTQSDKTTHFVVSFPSDTDNDAAYRAGRAWAEEMFAFGNYGDVYDYYTAFHTDRAHPHIHIVVNRRGMENGDWLKVSLRSQFNYNEFRAVQVEVAAREGIHLAASPRLARGVTERPVPDAEYRKAERERRKPMPPDHTPHTALKAAATLVLYSQQMNADAEHLRDSYPQLAGMMSQTAETILAGRQILPLEHPNQKILTKKDVQNASELIMSRRSELLDGLKEIDAEISTLPQGKDRSRLERDASRMKADTADLLPDVTDLQIHTIGNEGGLYQGLQAGDGIELEAKARADEEVGKLALDLGIDPAKFVSRFDGGEIASQELADSWRRDELEDIQKNLSYQPSSPQSKIEELTQAAYDELHRNALQTYRKAERELEAHSARKKELHRIAKLIREGRRLDHDVDDKFTQTVKDTLSSSELRALEAGHSDALQHITKDIDQQRALSRRYLESEAQDADGTRKLQISTALAKIDRDADLAAQQSKKLVQKDRGLDL